MDGNQFDVLTRSIAQRFSRRLTFRVLTAGIAAGALSQVDLEPADAAQCQTLGKSCRRRRGRPRPKCCSGSVCRGNKCECKPGREKCGNKCITKNQCCKNQDCPNNQRCDSKTNKCGCGKNQKRCQGVCIANSQCCTNDDCPANQACNNQHTCVAKACAGNEDCPSGVCTCGTNQDSGVCLAPVFSQTFQNSLSGWMSFAGGVDLPAPVAMSLVNGHAHIEPGDEYLAEPTPTAFSRLGGYSDIFPEGGFDLSLDVYLDLEDPDGNSGFAYTAGATRTTDCITRREFAFAVGTDADASQYCVRFSNTVNTNGTIGACSAEHEVLTGESGWYTFMHKFRDDNGVLAVTMEVLDPQGNLVGSRIRKNDMDTIGTIVGGSRHAWLPVVTKANGIDIRNSRRANVSP